MRARVQAGVGSGEVVLESGNFALEVVDFDSVVAAVGLVCVALFLEFVGHPLSDRESLFQLARVGCSASTKALTLFPLVVDPGGVLGSLVLETGKVPAEVAVGKPAVLLAWVQCEFRETFLNELEFVVEEVEIGAFLCK